MNLYQFVENNRYCSHYESVTNFCFLNEVFKIKRGIQNNSNSLSLLLQCTFFNEQQFFMKQ